MFLVYNPEEIPDNKEFISLWNKLAKENGLKGIYFVARVGAFSFSNRRSLTNYLEETNTI